MKQDQISPNEATSNGVTCLSIIPSHGHLLLSVFVDNMQLRECKTNAEKDALIERLFQEKIPNGVTLGELIAHEISPNPYGVEIHRVYHTKPTNTRLTTVTIFVYFQEVADNIHGNLLSELVHNRFCESAPSDMRLTSCVSESTKLNRAICGIEITRTYLWEPKRAQ